MKGEEYNKDYFQNGVEKGVSCYENYRWLPEVSIPFAYILIKYLDIQPKDKILDFGCAYGYMVKAFRLLYIKAFGFDISKHAIDNSPKDVKDCLFTDISKIPKVEWIIAKDVFEHISYDEIGHTLQILRKKCNKLFCIVPLGKSDHYNIPLFDKDITHIIKESIKWWKDLFIKNGFMEVEVKYRIPHMKDQYKNFKNGHGFFILTSG